MSEATVKSPALAARKRSATQEQGGRHVVRPAQTAFRVAMDEETAAVEECLAEGVTLVELDALAAMAGSRFAPSWARERYEVIG